MASRQLLDGDHVRVHDLEFCDSAGRVYSAGRNHGRRGIVVHVERSRVGLDYQCLVEIDGTQYWHWARDLLLVHDQQSQDRRHRATIANRKS